MLQVGRKVREVEQLGEHRPLGRAIHDDARPRAECRPELRLEAANEKPEHEGTRVSFAALNEPKRHALTFSFVRLP